MISAPKPTVIALIDSGREAALVAALPDLPTDLTGLIAQYDASLASGALETDQTGQVVNTTLNRDITEAIVDVLTSASADPVIKLSIFTNALKAGYVADLNQIMDGIRLRGLRINLDYVDFSHLVMGSVDPRKIEGPLRSDVQFLRSVPVLKLNDVSAVRAKFSHARLLNVDLAGADLTGADFSNTKLLRTSLIGANLSAALFDSSMFVMCGAMNLVTTDSGLKSLVLISSNKISLKLSGVHSTVQQNVLKEPLTLNSSLLPGSSRHCVIS